MTWYVAHSIMYAQFKDGTQNQYPILENLLLIEAKNDNEAFDKAISRAKEDEGDNSGSFSWEDRPATWVFAGIRKIIRVSHSLVGNNLSNGDELSYSEFSVPNETSLHKLIEGDEVTIQYIK